MTTLTDSIEVTAATVDEAVKQALGKLGAEADDVEIEVLTTPRAGVLGLGVRQARVRVTRRAPQGASSGVMSPPPAPPPKPRPAVPSPEAARARPAPPPPRPSEASPTTRLPEGERPGAREMPAEEEALVESLAGESPRQKTLAEEPRSMLRPSTRPPAPSQFPLPEEESAASPLPQPEYPGARAMPPEEEALVESLAGDVADTRPTADLKQQVAEGSSILKQILELMGEQATLEIVCDDDPDMLEINIKGDGSGLLIGRHGQTLDALEYIVNRIITRRIRDASPISVDTESYRARRRGQLHRMALAKGEEAKREHQAVTLEPMPPRDRRIIHLALKDDPLVTTRSAGDGFMRSVEILPVDERREGSGGPGGGPHRRRGRGGGPRGGGDRSVGQQGGFRHGQKRIV